MVPRYVPHTWLRKPGKGLKPWIDALLAIDDRKDKLPLIELLKSEVPLPRQARLDLADLLERYNLKRLPNKQRTPSYDLSDNVARLEAAKASALRSIKDDGTDREAAIQLSARVNGVTVDALRLHMRGSHSARKHLKRFKARLQP